MKNNKKSPPVGQVSKITIMVNRDLSNYDYTIKVEKCPVLCERRKKNYE